MDDSYTVHGNLFVPGPGITANDTDPDNDILHIGSCGTVAHGTLHCDTQAFSYEANYGYVGSDSFTYQTCDGYGLCDTGTVTLSVQNSAPVAVDDNFTFHGDSFFVPGPNALRENDSDPDGDAFSVVSFTQTSHGTVNYFYQYGALRYDLADPSYVGTDSFTYQICDNLGLCSSATVTFTVTNSPPVANDDTYSVQTGDTLFVPGPNALRENDSDPENDPIRVAWYTQTTNGTVNYSYSYGSLSYQPNDGFVGQDAFIYGLCDNLGLCSRANVTINVNPPPTPTPTPTPTSTPTPTPTPDGDRNLGNSCPNQMVGEPINVTNGNMLLSQVDYHLPGAGEAISFVRTYNSMASRFGLFGRGWSTGYDEGLVINSPTSLRLYMPDGRATDFSSDGSGSFAPVQTDFFGQINRNSDGTFGLSFKDGRVHRFTNFGALLSLADRNNNQTTLAYDGSGRLASITDPSGRSLLATTNTFGMLLSIGDSLGVIATYNYDSGSKLVSVTYADNSGLQFNYDGNNRLSSVSDVLGNVLESHAYDTQGRAVTSEKQGGVEHYSFDYVSTSETDVTDALGHVTKYFFDTSTSRNVVTRVEGLCSCGSGAQSQTWTYDNNLNVSSSTNSLNQVTTYTYDTQGNQLTMTNAAGTTTSTYNQSGEVLSVTDALGGTTSITYNDQGNPLSITDPLNHTTTYTSNSRGQLLTVTDARGKVSSLAYDSSGNLTTRTNALGNATHFTYDVRGRLTSTTNELGHVTSFVYDAVGRLSRITQADGSMIGYEYDLAGRRIAMTDAKGNRSTYAYDGAYRLISQTDAANQTTSVGYDAMSKRTSVTDALSRTTNYDYDDFNRPVKTTYPPATSGGTRLFESATYDAAGNVTQRTDTAGRVSSYAYDDVNRVTSTTDAANQTTSFQYDGLSRVTALTDAINQQYQFAYDALGRRTQITRGGVSMTFAYDVVGNRTRRTDYNNLTTNYAFDALNRLTKITYPDATTATYGYDKVSRLTTASNINGTVSFVYDELGRVTRTTDVWGQVINHTYDANGNRTRTSLGGMTAALYGYDPLNQLRTITDGSGLAADYAYDATGRVVSRALPNGVLTSYSYDGLDRLTRLQATGKKVITDNSYQYNDAGDLVQNTDPGGTHAYSYDPMDRLTSASYPKTISESYGYDGVGNRTRSQRSSTYSYQPFNRLVSTSTASYLSDNNGNLLAKNEGGKTTHFQWDFENRLTQVVTPQSGSVTYKYDGLSRRIQRAPSKGVATNFVYDGQDVVKDLNSDGSTVDYLNGPGIDNKIRQTSTVKHKTNALYYTTDHLGSTTALTNDKGHVVDEIEYDAFGNSTGSDDTRYDYTGRERDPLTGLLYYRARWYDPKLGRFISEDPIGLTGGINQFAYVGNNPQNAKDPTGLYEIDVHYYLTYYLVRKNKCFTEAEARLIADADQKTDENTETSPELGRKFPDLWNPDYNAQRKNANYHALSPDARKGQGSRELWDQAMRGPTNYVGFGRYLHYLQDTYSHAGYKDSTCGHGCVDWHFPDKTANDAAKAVEMAQATWYALQEYAKQKKCGCQGDWQDASWADANRFAKAYGGPDWREISSDELENKRIILGVPRR